MYNVFKQASADLGDVGMQEIDLKEYVIKAKNLEVAIFTQEKLITDYQKQAEFRGPKKPSAWIEPKNLFVYPQTPVRNTAHIFSIAFCVLMASVLLSCVITSLLLTDKIMPGLLLFAGLFVPIALIRSIVLLRKQETKKQYEQRFQSYLEELEKIKEKENIWEQEVKLSRKKYMTSLNQYLDNVEAYKKEVSQNINAHKQMLQQLKNALSDYYASDIVFEKYRNLVAISAITEYLQSGRCNTLEGPDGAYNLYEMELRQNIIIGQLSTIVTNVEQIKNNQYVLYHEIKTANQTVQELLTELDSDVKMAAYYAKLNAQIAAAPTYTVGYIS